MRPLNAKEASLLAPIDTSKAFQGDGGLAASPSRTQSTIAAMRSNYIRNIIAPVDDRVLVFAQWSQIWCEEVAPSPPAAVAAIASGMAQEMQ